VVRISLGCDHAGYSLKQEILGLLSRLGHETQDRGCFSELSVDYPDFAALVCDDVVGVEADLGILICGSGIGMSIAANKRCGVRAALCHDTYSAKMSRQHNDANVLCLGQRIVGVGLALEIVTAWLENEFAGGKHALRLQKIAEQETINKTCRGADDSEFKVN